MFKCCLQVNSESLHAVSTHSRAHTHICTHTGARTGPLGLPAVRSLAAPHPAVPLLKAHAGAVAPAPASASMCGTNPQLLGRKATTNLDSMLKSRDLTLPAKV